MAYIPHPDIHHDLYLSYAREDVAWVSALQEQLAERLLYRLGYECSVWQDVNKIRTGQVWSAELEKAVRASAAMIAVLSRHSQSSKWVGREIDTILDEAQRPGSLETSGYGRLLKVIKFPWVNNAHEGFYRQYQHVVFFDVDSKTGQEREFKTTSEQFRKAVDRLSFHVGKLFEAVLRGMDKIFVARAADDVSDERDAIAREIRAVGYPLSPPPLGVVPKGLDRQVIEQFISEARSTVHVLGAQGDRELREQIDIALDAGKRVLFYLAPGSEAATGEQKTLIDNIRENKWGLNAGAWDLLEGRSLAAVRRDLIASLARTSRTKTNTAENSIPRVYLLCDPTTTADVSFARQMQSGIQEVEGMRVDLPPSPESCVAPRLEHERLLTECEGLLLYHAQAPSKWYSRNFADLLMAEDRPNRTALKSRAVLSNAKIEYPGVTTIERRDPFELYQLEPFLAPLRIREERGARGDR